MQAGEGMKVNGLKRQKIIVEIIVETGHDMSSRERLRDVERVVMGYAPHCEDPLDAKCFLDVNATVKGDERNGRSYAVTAADLIEAREVLANAAIVLEVLSGQIRMKPYKELSREMQTEIQRVTLLVRKVLLPTATTKPLSPPANPSNFSR
jgi:hypothetical protein